MCLENELTLSIELEEYFLKQVQNMQRILRISDMVIIH